MQLNELIRNHILSGCVKGLRCVTLPLAVLLLVGCSVLQTPVPTTVPTQIQSGLVVTTPTQPATLTSPPPTAIPTEVSRNFKVYRHVSNVFSMTLPADWEALDASTEHRLLVRYIPPVGYASRVTVDVTNEGPLPPYEVEALAESYVHLHYAGDNGYTEVQRAELPDGRKQFIFLYDDGRGAKGRETLYIQQVGPYFSALKVFLADKDQYYLSNALDAMTSSFTVDPLAVWGSAVAAINPAELLVVNALLWRDEDGLTYYTGEVYNASPSPINEVNLRVALCSESGIVMAETNQEPALDVIRAGGSSPFGVVFEDMPENLTVCARQVSAKPAPPTPDYTTSLALTPVADEQDDNIVVRGTVGNPGLSPIGDVAVFIVVYNTDGLVVGYNEIAYEPGQTFAPGADRPFNHTFGALGGEAERFVVLAQGWVIHEHNPSLVPEEPDSD